MSFKTLSKIAGICNSQKKEFWKVIIEDDAKERGVTEEESFAQMTKMYRAMKTADVDYDPNLRSASGLSGGDGAKLEVFRKQSNRLIGDFLTEVMEKAVKMAAALKVPILGLVENMSYFKCPDCGKKHEIFGKSHLEEIAGQYKLNVLGRIPIDPLLAAECDAGQIETLENIYLQAVLKK